MSLICNGGYEHFKQNASILPTFNNKLLFFNSQMKNGNLLFCKQIIGSEHFLEKRAKNSSKYIYIKMAFKLKS